MTSYTWSNIHEKTIYTQIKIYVLLIRDYPITYASYMYVV